MSKPFKPMLAADISDDLDKLRFPVYATPKLDGVRALIFADGVYSRSMKKIPNECVQARFGQDPDLIGLDGELIVGEPTALDVYRATNSIVSRLSDATPVQFFVFDDHSLTKSSYSERVTVFQKAVVDTFTPGVMGVQTRMCEDMAELEVMERLYLDAGYEGMILRSTDGLYKQGRSTVREQGMCKLKRFIDSEIVITGMEEEQHNANEAKINELGHTERSSHKANLIGKGTMGVLIGRDDIKFPGQEVRVGSGFTAKDKETFWQNKEQFIGKIAKYKYFPIGVKDKPRHGIYLGMREGWDL